MPIQDVIKNTLDLLETMEEGLTYIKQKLKELNTEVTVTVLADTINAFSAIEKSINPMLEELASNEIVEKADKLKRAFDIMVNQYENNSGQKALEIIQLTLEPSFKSWKVELERVLKPYIVS